MPHNTSHAWLSPSTMGRILKCPGSAVISRDLPRKCSADAALGTLAHKVAEECLSSGADPLHAFDLGHAEEIDGHLVTVDQEMVEAVMLYIDAVNQYATLGALMVEVAVPIELATGEEGAHGTADAIVIAGDELIVIDLKYGKGVAVYPDHNPQLMMYALGALEVVYLLGNTINKVRLVIHQPRVRKDPIEWVCPIDELIAFDERVKLATHDIWMMRDGELPLKFNPSLDACRFCPAKPCAAMTKHAFEVTAADFDNLDKPPTLPELTEPAHLAELAAKVDFVEKWFESWCEMVRGKVMAELLAGRDVSGYKLVEGKRGDRKWSDPKEVEVMLKKMRMKIEQMYELSLISPTKAEKLFAENPRRWSKLQNYVTQSAGKLSIAPVNDKRPAIKPAEAVIAEFEKLPADD